MEALLQHHRGGFKMSLQYCPDCDGMIDLDYDIEHEHFSIPPEIKDEFKATKEIVELAYDVGYKDGKGK